MLEQRPENPCRMLHLCRNLHGLGNPIPIDFVEQRPQAHAEPLRRRAAVAVGRLQGIKDGTALCILDRRSEGAVPCVLTPCPPLHFVARGNGAEVSLLQHLFLVEHRRALDGVLELSDVPPPGLLLEPRDRVVAYCKRSEEHTSELQSPCNLVCRLLLEKKKKNSTPDNAAITRDTENAHELHQREACMR